MREVVNHLKSEFRRGNGARRHVARNLAKTESNWGALRTPNPALQRLFS
jgi:hypothetical protein